MTTTHTFKGINTDNRPSSRVLNPPGGSSSNIFGGDANQSRQPATARNNPDASREKSNLVRESAPTGQHQQQSRAAARSGFNPITGEAYAQPVSTSKTASQNTVVDNVSPEVDSIKNTTGDVVLLPVDDAAATATKEVEDDASSVSTIVAEPAAAVQPAPPAKREQPFGGGAQVKEHTSTRVSQPPGGRSSKLW